MNKRQKKKFEKKLCCKKYVNYHIEKFRQEYGKEMRSLFGFDPIVLRRQYGNEFRDFLESVRHCGQLISYAANKIKQPQRFTLKGVIDNEQASEEEI